MRTILLRVSALAFVVCTGFTQPTSTSQSGAQVHETVNTQRSEGRAGNGQDSNEFYAWSAPAAVREQDSKKDVLLVLDPNGLHCWEDVDIDSVTNSTLLPFIHTLGDALTVGKLPGSLLPLQLPIGLEGETEAATFTELIEEAWRSQASTIRLPSQLLVAFQMTLLCPLHPHASPPSACLDSARLKVTHVESFWTAVEQTVAAGHLVTTDSHQPVEGALSKTVIILPRIVTRLHPVYQEPEQHIYRDLAAWDVDFVIQMLQEFLRVTSAKTFPSLAEYRILPDKVQLQSMYEAYYAADPSNRTPPIPTVNLRLSHPRQRESELCNGAETTDSEQDVAKTALLNAVFDLEKALSLEHPVRYMVDASGSDWMGRYIIKREYSEGSHHVFGLTLPQLDPLSSSADNLQPQQGQNAADAVASAPMGNHADTQHAGTPECSTVPAHSPQQLGFVLSHMKAAASKMIHLSSFIFKSPPSSTSAMSGSQVEAELQPLGGQSSDLGPTIHACMNPDLAAHGVADILPHSSGDSDSAARNGSWGYAGLQVPAELNSLLAETADRLLHHSCGEGWLVQPRVANMSGLEYRVYLLGGASAMNKVENNAVVYTPCSLHDEGLRTYNITMPQGMICSDVLPDPGEKPAEIVTTSWRQYELWAAPEVYSMILKAAHDGAQAMIDSPQGHLMRMVSDVMVRVDVVLGAQWDPTGQVLLWPMINEMDWFNSAGMLSSFWKGSLPNGIANEEQAVPFESEAEGQEMLSGTEAGEGGSREASGMREVQGSAGFKIAQALYREILELQDV